MDVHRAVAMLSPVWSPLFQKIISVCLTSEQLLSYLPGETKLLPCGRRQVVLRGTGASLGGERRWGCCGIMTDVMGQQLGKLESVLL